MVGSKERNPCAVRSLITGGGPSRGRAKEPSVTPIPHHPYVSHLVRVAPRPAGIGLDFARSCLMAQCRADADEERLWAVCTPAGTLRLGGPFHRIVPRPRGYRPLRGATGLLHPAGRGLRPIEVTLELLPWSSRWSELALI